MSSGVFGPYCKLTDKIKCPHCNKVQQVGELQKRGGNGTPPWYACQCSPDDVIVADPGNGRIQFFEETHRYLVAE